MRDHLLGMIDSPDDGILLDAWERMERHGLVERVFYDGGVIGPQTFMEFARHPSLKFYALTVDGTPQALAWLTHFEGGTARIHYSGLGGMSTARHAVALGRYFSRWALTAEVNGAPWLHTLIGLTPARNTVGLRYITQVGLHLVARIPEAIRNADGTVDDAILSYLNRRDV